MISILTFSCYDEIGDVADLQVNNFNPTYNVPVLRQSTSLVDVLNNVFDSVAIERLDGQERIRFRTQLEGVRANDLFELTDSPARSFSLPIDASPFPGIFTYREVRSLAVSSPLQVGGDKYSEIKFSAGTFNAPLFFFLPARGNISMEILNLTDELGNPFVLTYFVNNLNAFRSSLSISNEASLEGYSLVFTNPDIPLLNVDVEFDLTVNGNLLGSSFAEIQYEMRNMEFETVRGVFGSHSETISDFTNIDFFDSPDIDDFTFSGTEFDIVIDNGFDVELDFVLGQLSIPSFFNPQVLVGTNINNPSTISANSESTIRFTNQNSNIDAFLNARPSLVNYRITGAYTPSIEEERIINKDDVLQPSIEISVPLQLSINGYQYEDGFDANFNGVDWDAVKQLRLSLSNELPADISIVFDLVDSRGLSIGNLTDELIFVEASSSSSEVVEVDVEKQNNLSITDRINFRTLINTPGNQPQSVSSTAKLQLDLSIVVDDVL